MLTLFRGICIIAINNIKSYDGDTDFGSCFTESHRLVEDDKQTRVLITPELHVEFSRRCRLPPLNGYMVEQDELAT